MRVREAGGLSGEDRGRYMERQKNKEGGVRKLLAQAPPLSPLQHRPRFKSPSAANQQLPGSVVTVHGGGVREKRNWVLPSTGSRGHKAPSRADSLIASGRAEDGIRRRLSLALRLFRTRPLPFLQMHHKAPHQRGLLQDSG